MNSIWVFGDSFSADYNVSGSMSHYVKWKGRIVKNFANFLGEHYKMDVKNFGFQGWDNYSIFESLCKKVDEIKDDDFIFVGWGGVHRYRFVNHKSNQWFTVNGETCHSHLSTFMDMDLNSYLNFLVNRNHMLNEYEVDNWSKLIKKAHPKNFVHIWRWGGWGSDDLLSKFESVKDETKGEVDDFHWSENGHKNYAETLILKIDEWRINK